MTRKNVLALVIAAGLVALSATSEADQTFGVHSLRGGWGFSAAGTLGGGTIEASAVGQINFDGGGGCTETAKLNAGGVVTPLTSLQCSYTVNPDGTGTLKVTFSVGTFTADFVLVDNAKEFQFIVSDPATNSTVARGVGKRQ